MTRTRFLPKNINYEEKSDFRKFAIPSLASDNEYFTVNSDSRHFTVTHIATFIIKHFNEKL